VPKTVVDKKSFTFVGGLNTEAGYLTYPANTWSDGDNVVPTIDGSLRKRTAVNYENGYATSSTTNTANEEQNGAFVVGEWNSVAGNGARNFVVVQRSSKIYFYDNTGDAISATEKSFTIDLSTYKASGNPNAAGIAPISCTSGNGYLIVTSADTEPLLVTYNEGSGTITVAAISVQTRDLWGTNDGLVVDNKPSTLSNAHKYNLLNQGWTDSLITTYKAGSTGSVYPSNAQTWTSGKDSSDNFSAALLDKQDFGTSPAPKGRFLLNVFNRDRSTASGVSGVTAETETYRPAVCAFYAGRAWYAGIRSTSIGSWVLFSQVASTTDKYGKCYQDGDPSSEFIHDLVDSDGGIIPIQDAGNIVRLVVSYNSLIVFADNGVWQISGGSTSVFSATSYDVKKLTSVGCVGGRSVIEAEGILYYWSTDGIWTVKTNSIGTQFDVLNLTNTTIQTLYTTIPIYGRTYSSGRYYLEGKTIYWLYNSDTSQDGVTRRFKKNKLLCFDLRLQAFYTVSVGSLVSNSPYVMDLTLTKTKSTANQTYNVIDASSNNVVDNSGTLNQVVASLAPLTLHNSEPRFLVQLTPDAGTSFKVTFARFEDGNNISAKFADWYAVDSVGIGYSAYIITGFDLGNQQGGDKELQGLYLVSLMRRTETGIDSSGNPINPSSCQLQARWDFTDTSTANKWSVAQEIYRHKRLFFPSVPLATYDDGYPVVTSKSKIRGRGKSVQFKFTADPTKDMQIQGWAVIFLGNGNV
jgi:hypothetical protein